MSTALAILQKSTEIELSELEQLILEESGNDVDAYDPIPTRIGIAPGGIGNFRIGGEGGELAKEFNAIIVVSQKSRAYWSNKSMGNPPLCSSKDGSRGEFNDALDQQVRDAANAREPHPALRLLDAGEELPAAFSCAECPLNQWGSDHLGGGASKACKEMRRLVILVRDWTTGALLTLPPTSIKAFDQYASDLARERSAYWAVWTKIELENDKSANGDAYSKAKFSKVAPLSAKDEIKAVIELRKEYQAHIATMDIEGAEYSAAPVEDGGDAEDLPF